MRLRSCKLSQLHTVTTTTLSICLPVIWDKLRNYWIQCCEKVFAPFLAYLGFFFYMVQIIKQFLILDKNKVSKCKFPPKSNNRLCHPWQQEPQSGIFDKWQRFFHITVEELCPTFLCRTRHVTVPQSDLSPAFDSATPKPSFRFLSPFRGGLAGVFRIIIMLYIPSALELQAVNCCCGSINYIKSS